MDQMYIEVFSWHLPLSSFWNFYRNDVPYILKNLYFYLLELLHKVDLFAMINFLLLPLHELKPFEDSEVCNTNGTSMSRALQTK